MRKQHALTEWGVASVCICPTGLQMVPPSSRCKPPCSQHLLPLPTSWVMADLFQLVHGCGLLGPGSTPTVFPYVLRPQLSPHAQELGCLLNALVTPSAMHSDIRESRSVLNAPWKCVQVAQASLLMRGKKNWYESLSNFVFKNLSLTLCKAEDHFKMITWIILEGANVTLPNLSCACWNKSGS